MRRAWWFNPENDGALARDTANYTPPAAALKLHQAGEALPLWLAGEDDAVICNGLNDKWLGRLQDDFGIVAGPWDHNPEGYTPTPWGWSAAARRFFSLNGFNNSALPSPETLAEWRMLSHRRTGAKLAGELATTTGLTLWPEAKEADSAAALAEALSAPGNYVLKSPWSSSGRGVVFVPENRRDKAIRSAEGIIRSQGSVMVERAARRLLDFALLWDCAPDGCRFRGYSVFRTDESGAYRGNIVDRQEALREIIGRHIDIGVIDRVAAAVPEALGKVLGGRYTGPAGIDMLVAETADGPVLDAVVEVNLRYTMGFVSLALARIAGVPSLFSVERGDISSSCRAEVSGGKLTGGRLALTQPGNDFTFMLAATGDSAINQ